MRLRRIIIVVLVAALNVLPSTHAMDGDAGVADASNVESAPTLVPGWGQYSGSFATPNDPDWYSAPTNESGPGCLSAKLQSSTWTQVTLESAAHAITGVAPPSSSPVVVSIASFGRADKLGLVPSPDPTSGAPPMTGSYAFKFNFAPWSSLGSGDADSNGDAGSSFATAVPLDAPCSAGSLAPLQGDATDVFTIPGTAGQQAVISLASDSSAVGATVTDEAGIALATVTATGIAAFTFPSTGTYQVTTTTASTSPATYVVSFIGGDPTTPCRPYCAAS